MELLDKNVIEARRLLSQAQKIADEKGLERLAKKISADGSGLGLPAVKQIVERHGGNVQVESPSPMGNKNNPGSCFTVVLPYKIH